MLCFVATDIYCIGSLSDSLSEYIKFIIIYVSYIFDINHYFLLSYKIYENLTLHYLNENINIHKNVEWYL